MSEFKNFSEALLCDIIPFTYDKKIYLTEKVVSEEEFVVAIGGKDYNTGETYYDYIAAEVATIDKLADFALQELYKRGFSTRHLELIEKKVILDYSFLDNMPWIAKRELIVLAYGDVTADDDHRRDGTRRGQWFTLDEAADLLDEYQMQEIIERLEDE